jgi:hypothetical protein
MMELGRIGGVNIRCADVASDTHIGTKFQYLRSSGDAEKPNWQFNRGTTLWEAMQRVRERSGWLLYPDDDDDNRDGLYYCPKPAGDETPKYTINANNAEVTNVSYRSIDIYRTRIFVIGKARQASASDGTATLTGDYTKASWRYKKDDILLGCGLNYDLEEDIGESRPLVVIDPGFVDWLSIGMAVLRLYDYYTTEHIIPVFQINAFENYPDLYLYDIIKWIDDTQDYFGEKLIEQNIMVTTLRVMLRKFTSVATVNSTIAEQAVIERILSESKRRSEAGMEDKNEFIKGLEAIANEDYVKMNTETPAAIRIFAHKENGTEWKETRDYY